MDPRCGGSLVPRSGGSLVRTYSGSLVLYWPMPCLRPLRGMRTRVKRVVHRPRTQRTTEPGEGDLLTRQAGRERRSRPYRACQAGSMTQGYSSVTEPRGGWGGVASSISRLSEPRCVGHPIALGPGRDRTPSVASRGCGHPVHLLEGSGLPSPLRFRGRPAHPVGPTMMAHALVLAAAHRATRPFCSATHAAAFSRVSCHPS